MMGMIIKLVLGLIAAGVLVLVLMINLSGSLDDTIRTPEPAEPEPVAGEAPALQPEPAAEEDIAEEDTADPEDMTDALFIPGTYTASAQGHGGTLTISVEFDEYSIMDITVTDHGETLTFFIIAAPPLISSIIEAQSTDVPVMAGATETADAIIEAVELAIQQALD